MWLPVTIIAYFLFAVSSVIDKTIISKSKVSPLAYVFSIAVLGGVLILLVLPFGFGMPSGSALWISLLAGVVSIWALFLMFKALEKEDASRLMPMIGGIVPIFVLLLAWFILEEKLSSSQYLGFIFLILGTFLIALDFKKRGFISWLKNKLGFKQKFELPKIRQTIWLALPSAVLFAINSVLTKFVFNSTTFLTGFIWINLGSLFTILILLVSKNNRNEIKTNLKKQKNQPKMAKKTAGRFIFGQICAGLGNILKYYAIFLGSVTLINALAGVQYAFIFLLATILSFVMPKLLKEKITKEIVVQKVIAILLISVGMYFLSIYTNSITKYPTPNGPS